MSIGFDNQVAIVTGAGNGLGRCHALALAERGAKVVVNDLGDSDGGQSAAAQAVVDEIVASGGEAIAHGANVAKEDQVEDMVAQTMERWGRVDILINNAGILRDKTFSKMIMDDLRLVVDVHLVGSAICSKAVWEIMRKQNYGRIVMTTSSSGLFGNFGQSNYGAAKAGVVGLMNVLHHEGQKYNIRVNAVAPTAATQMTEKLLPELALELLQPERVSPGVLYLVSDDAPSKVILGAGAGAFACIRIVETPGIHLKDEDLTPESIAENWEKISNPEGQVALKSAADQTSKYFNAAVKALGAN
ncbi:MAG: 3-oxoacyl-ACP reductase [Alphaproteobacteria bacterium]|nr:MAG: 3-oxoacyl-ACP reductase [Alphaproteobacteria bacterium]